MSGDKSNASSSSYEFFGLWPGWTTTQGEPLAAVPVMDEEHVRDTTWMSQQEQLWSALTLPIPTQRSCMVPGCPVPNCNLGTHRKFSSGSPRQSQSSTTEEKQEEQRTALSLIERYRSGSPSSDGVDGFPALPIEESLDPNIRALFHFFFTNSFERLALLFRGPSVRDMHTFKERMLATALTSEVYCRSLLLQAQTEQDSMKAEIGETQNTMLLYNNTLKALRELLEAIHKRPHPLQMELGLLVLCILVAYTAAHDRDKDQKVHWQGLRDLVAMRGGMHCVSMALAYVIHADRSCAIRFSLMPTYTNKLRQPLPTPIPLPGSVRYGAKLSAMRTHSANVDHAVLDYLLEVCGLVELWEESKLHPISRPRRGVNISSEYLYFVRDRLDEGFAILNAQWAQVNTVERCLLWASRIIEYHCTWSNYIGSITLHHHHQLIKVLQQQESIQDVWRPDIDVPIWIMFVLTTVESTSEIHEWRVQRLRDLLDTKYRATSWPSMWWADQQENLLKFVWSGSRYTESFRRVCDELEKRS